MGKAAKQKPAAKPRGKKAQHERFQQTARELGIDDDASAEAFERSFTKIVPVRTKSKND